MKEENELLKKYGNKNPYKVPEGYFSEFADKLMEQLPEKEVTETPKISAWTRMKPWVYMAAMFVGLMFTVRMVTGFKGHNGNQTNVNIEAISDLPDEYIEPIVNQTMMDDYELYQYLTDADPSIYQ
ncbi:hypothetical protein [uncultured Bacteroides sp.]|uniref:hypothetical protein n=1 Tax=uncultured Bacteroides sp. TaxID=162156 RepID=UPI0026222D10|nr:hypothetical protein [uncultured Bacteroides sp.]